MSERTLVGSFPVNTYANGRMQVTEHTIFAFESGDQTKSWKIKEIQCWLNPMVECGGDGRSILNYCLSTDFLTPPSGGTADEIRIYANQFNASDNRGIAWGMTDYQNRNGTANDFRTPGQGIVPFGMIADGRRAINYLILNTINASQNSALAWSPGLSQIGISFVNYRVVMEEIKVTPSESILHQVRGLAQDVS